MCVSKVKHMMGRKTGCNRSRPVFFGFLIFQQTSQPATEEFQNLCNHNQWSGLLQLGSVRFWSFFQSSELDLQTLLKSNIEWAALAEIILVLFNITIFLIWFFVHILISVEVHCIYFQFTHQTYVK